MGLNYYELYVSYYAFILVEIKASFNHLHTQLFISEDVKKCVIANHPCMNKGCLAFSLFVLGLSSHVPNYEFSREKTP